MSNEQGIDLILNLPTDNQYWESNYSGMVLDPKAWKSSADHLMLTLRTLSVPLVEAWAAFVSQPHSKFPQQLFIHPTFLLLVAYSLENLAKGLIVKGLVAMGSGSVHKLPKAVKSHNLVELIKNVGVALSQEDLDLLHRLTVYGTWAGRYPGPVTIQEAKPQHVDGKQKKLTYWRGSDIAVAFNLLEHISELYDDPQQQRVSRENSRFDSAIVHETVKPWAIAGDT